MDVENEALQHMISSSDGASSGPFPTMSDADLETSQHCIAVFLSSHMAHELLPESGKVIALDVDLTVKQAFHILHEQGISMAPLWGFSKGKFVGVLSALDFILIMRSLAVMAPAQQRKSLRLTLDLLGKKLNHI